MPDGDHVRLGTGEPLVLLHGLGMSWRAWRPVLDGLAAHHDVIAPTLPGHRGASRSWPRPFTVAALTDAVQAGLDELGVRRAHVAGNSLGGYVALELARRGTALSVTAFSPTGAWAAPADLLRLQLALAAGWAALAGPLAPLWCHNGRTRRLLLGRLMEHAERLPTAHARELLLDVRRCRAFGVALDSGRRSGMIDPLPADGCPVHVVWPECDQVLPFARYGRPLLERLPHATCTRLPGTGHVPLYDRPDAVRDLILADTGAVPTTEGAA